MKPGRRAKNAAFASITAIVMLGLVASMLAAMAMMFAADARRTRSSAAEAQLRQLLLAGAADAQQRLDKGHTTFDVNVTAPAESHLHLAATLDGDAVRTVISATLGPRHAEQTLRFTRAGNNKWQLAAVELRP
jgi:type II secretory pathway component PulK